MSPEDIAALRRILANGRAAGWETHLVYGTDGDHDHVWRGDRGQVELYRGTLSVDVGQGEWRIPAFSMAEVGRALELTGALPGANR